MWTTENRASYDRSQLRYPSDMTDEEWAHIGPLIPPARRGGRKRRVDVREVVNGLMYVLSTGCQWRAIPRRWVVERTFAWLGRCRRLAKDFENLTKTARAFLILASIRLMMRKLCLNT